MAGVNKALILGRLGRDPEMKTSQSGTAVCRFSVAVTEKYNGNEQTEWFSLVAFGKTAEVAAKYLAKGSQVFIEGRIQTRKYQDRSGNDRTATEIIVGSLTMLGGGKSSGSGSEARRGDDHGKSHGRSSSNPKDGDPFEGDFGPPPTEDDFPF